MIRIFTFVFLFVLGYIYITLKLYLDNMIVSLTEYALIFIIFDITLCFHVFLSILRRNRGQLFEGFLCFLFIIPINIVNIIYFFLIKPIAILSSSVNLLKCFPLCIAIVVIATLNVVLIWFLDYIEFNSIVSSIFIFIFGIIDGIVYLYSLVFSYEDLFELSLGKFFVIYITPFCVINYFISMCMDRLYFRITRRWKL